MPRQLEPAMIATDAIVHRGTIVVAVVVCLLAGCATNRALMPTPVLYTGPNAKPLFTDSPIEPLTAPRSICSSLPIARRRTRPGDLPYTAERSRAIAFGSAMVEFGEGVPWAVLVDTEQATQAPLDTASLGADDGARALSADPV